MRACIQVRACVRACTVCVSARTRAFVCVRACVRDSVCVCVCVCVCVHRLTKANCRLSERGIG